MATIGLKKLTLKLSKSFVSNATKEFIHDADEEEKKEKLSHLHPHETVLLKVPQTLPNSKSTPTLKNVLSNSSLKDLDFLTTKSKTNSTNSINNNNNVENKKYEKPVFHFDNEFDSTDEHGIILFR